MRCERGEKVKIAWVKVFRRGRRVLWSGFRMQPRVNIYEVLLCGRKNDENI